MELLQELLQLNERVDTMLDQLHYHFSKKIVSPLSSFSDKELISLTYQLEGLIYLRANIKKLDKFDDFSRIDDNGKSLKFMKFLNDISERNQAKIFNDRKMTADEYLEEIGKISKAKDVYKIFDMIKNKDPAGLVKLNKLLSELYGFYKQIVEEFNAYYSKNKEVKFA